MPQHLGSQSYEVMQTKITEEEEEEVNSEPLKKDARKERPSSSLYGEFKQPDVGNIFFSIFFKSNLNLK